MRFFAVCELKYFERKDQYEIVSYVTPVPFFITFVKRLDHKISSSRNI